MIEVLQRKKRVGLIDTTFRDGLQSPLYLSGNKKNNLRGEEVQVLGRALMEYGVLNFEVFSPNVGKRQAETIEILKAERDDHERRTGQRAKILAHVRCNADDVDAAVAAGVDGLNFYFGTSPQSRENNHGKSLTEIVNKAQLIMGDERDKHPHLLLRFSGEDAFRTDAEDLKYVYDGVAPIVHRLGMPDTVGYANRQEIYDRVTDFRSRYPDKELGGHFHNDLNRAMDNAIVGIEAGMDLMDTTILGFAERSGLPSMTGLLYLLSRTSNPALIDGYVKELSFKINQLFACIHGIEVPSTELVSQWNRTHVAGVHAHAVLNDPSAYEGGNLGEWGVPFDIKIGPLTGRDGVHDALEKLGYTVGGDVRKLQIVTNAYKAKAGNAKTGEDMDQILADIADTYHLPYVGDK